MWIQIESDNAFNPASLLPGEGNVQNCLQLIEHVTKSPLNTEPLPNVWKRRGFLPTAGLLSHSH